MITIKHRSSDTTLCEFNVETIKQATEQGKSDLREANLYGANLRGANLYGADLCGANLCGANLRGADLREANLYGANLYGANLRGADLYGANLRGADLYGANLREVNLYGTDLYGANLRGADLYGAKVDDEKIEKHPIQISCGLRYDVLITENYMRLGCKRFTHEEWAAFTDAQIDKMDNGALEFWKQWKAPLLTMCETHKKGD